MTSEKIHCSNGGCQRPPYRGRYCYRCWVGVKWFSLTARLRNLNGRCSSYIGIPLGMTREEFIKWAIENPPPSCMVQPSLDRIVNERGYRLDNIQWLELRQNSRDAQKDVPLTHRRCNPCGRTLPLDSDNFHRNKKDFLGFNSHCKRCRAKKRNKEAWA